MAINATQAAATLQALPGLVTNQDSSNRVAELAQALMPVVPQLWRVGIHRFLTSTDELEIVAVWSAGPTSLVPSLRVSVVATPFP